MYKELGAEQPLHEISEPFRSTVLEWTWDTEHHQLQIDQALCRQILHSELPSLTGNVLLPCMSYSDQTALLSLLEKSCQFKSQQRFCCCLQLSDQNCCYVELRFRGEDPKLVKGTLTPLLFLHATASMISELFAQLFNNSHHGVVLLDDEREIIACNDYFLQNSHYQHSALVGRSIDTFNSEKHHAGFFQNIWQHTDSNGSWSGTVLLKSARGKTYPQGLTTQKITLEERVFYLATYLDLSHQLYRIDEAESGGVELNTQLLTQEQFTRSITHDWMTEAQSSIGIVVAFAPQFEPEEDFDSKGALAEQLRNNRMSKHVGYLGSDHFVAYLECSTSSGPSQVRMIHQTVRRFFSELSQVSAKAMHNAIVRGRVGVSVLGHDTHNTKTAVSHALQAMLQQDVARRGQITFYHTALENEVLRRKDKQQWVERLVKSQQVEVHYQPIIDVKKWKIAKFEALSRFRGPNGKLFNSDEMIAIAEELDLIIDLDWMTAKQALLDLDKIQQQFEQKISISINRSLNSKLVVDEALQSIDALIHQYASQAEYVTVELNESAYFDSQSHQSSLIRSLRRRGVKVAIDKFATGYSSIAHLSEGNFDVVKIDRVFIKDIKLGSHKCTMVKAIIQFAHTFKAKVVAVGVETEQELEVVCGLGVDYVQGYFLAKPLPLDELAKAWNYKEKIEKFLSSQGRAKQAGILSLAQVHLPTLAPTDTIIRAIALFNSPHYQLEVIPIVDNKVCVGVVGREELNKHMFSAQGTSKELLLDSTINNKTLDQIMRRDVHSTLLQTPASHISEMVRCGLAPPWLVVTESGDYLGLVTSQTVLQHLVDG
ncbi:diguanylate cyclase [Vibrio galatheae]|uniref:Diguanylate cyclase n=1 Tax=Vibrio galatheae TaxID=579748 RepID=A0A0F4NPS5_9VIBR|nr:EAL domain-containing protein [Vibrio galatheae]KJY84843.1 diguanylate cyclase [Vibrio galatheae]